MTTKPLLLLVLLCAGCHKGTPTMAKTGCVDGSTYVDYKDIQKANVRAFLAERDQGTITKQRAEIARLKAENKRLKADYDSKRGLERKAVTVYNEQVDHTQGSLSVYVSKPKECSEGNTLQYRDIRTANWPKDDPVAVISNVESLFDPGPFCIEYSNQKPVWMVLSGSVHDVPLTKPSKPGQCFDLALNLWIDCGVVPTPGGVPDCDVNGVPDGAQSCICCWTGHKAPPKEHP